MKNLIKLITFSIILFQNFAAAQGGLQGFYNTQTAPSGASGYSDDWEKEAMRERQKQFWRSLSSSQQDSVKLTLAVENSTKEVRLKKFQAKAWANELKVGGGCAAGAAVITYIILAIVFLTSTKRPYNKGNRADAIFFWGFIPLVIIAIIGFFGGMTQYPW